MKVILTDSMVVIELSIVTESNSEKRRRLNLYQTHLVLDMTRFVLDYLGNIRGKYV